MKLALKIGGSVLREERSYQAIAHEIENIIEVYNPEQTFIIVSALKGRTDKDISNISVNGDEAGLRNALKDLDEFPKYDNSIVSSYLIQGEIDSALRLGRNLNANVLDQNNWAFPIIANSGYLSAKIDYDRSDERAPYLDHLGKIVVVSGFGAINNQYEKVLLGRNASDLVAAMIARQASVNRLVYLKDIDGIYNDFGTSKQEKLDEIIYDLSMGFDFGEVLDNRIFDVLDNNSLDIVVGHHNDMLGLIGDYGVGTKIKLF
jgi:aspartokinase